MRPIMMCARVWLVLILTSAAVLIPGCGREKPISEQGEVQLSGSSPARELYRSLEERQRSGTNTYIRIEPMTITLPKIGDPNEPADREYQIDVYVENQDAKLSDILHEKLRVDVLGVRRAEISPAVYAPIPDASKSTAAQPSKNLVHIRVRAQDIQHSLKVIAHFPQEADRDEHIQGQRLMSLATEIEEKSRQANPSPQEKKALEKLVAEWIEIYSRPNPYRQVCEIPVFNGDLITQIFLLSYDEVEDAFGPNFAKYFRVGRVYFKNRHADKKLIVNTTSLRARCLFYRRGWAFPLSSLVTSDKKQGKLSDAELEYSVAQIARLSGYRTATGIALTQVDDILNQVVPHLPKLAAPDPNAAKKEARNGLEKFIDRMNLGTAQKEEAMQIASTTIDKLAGVVSKFANDPNLDDLSKMPRLAQRAAVGRGTVDISDGQAKRPPNAEEAVIGVLTQVKTQNLVVRPTSVFQNGQIEGVGPTNKRLATSSDTHLQELLSRTGYLFEDYYRPMTFEAVLISLIKKTEGHRLNQALRILESLGVGAGALVGLSAAGSEFGTTSFAQWVAVSTGVFTPEARKLLMQNVEEYLPNLASLALGTQFTIGPNESRDGYVFFPKGPIFGFGVDEFSLHSPSYIVNIDNSNVAVDATLVEQGFEFSSGVLEPKDLVASALASIQERRSLQREQLQQASQRLEALRSSVLREEVSAAISEGRPEEAAALVQEFGEEQTTESGKALVRELQNKITEAQGRAGLVLYDDSGTRLSTVFEAKRGNNGEITGKYSLRLDELAKEAQAWVIIEPGETGSGLTFSVEDPDKTTAENLYRPSQTIEFTDANWHERRHIWLKYSPGTSGSLSPTTLSIRHRVLSRDGALDGERRLWLSIPK